MPLCMKAETERQALESLFEDFDKKRALNIVAGLHRILSNRTSNRVATS